MSILRALLSNATRCRSSNVSRSVDGLRHLTKNVPAICIVLSVSCGQLKFRIGEKFPGFQAAGGHFVSLSPSAVQISWGGNIDIFTPELRTSQSSW